MLALQWKKICCALSASALLGACALAGDAPTMTVKVDQPGITVSPTLYGIFYEEINRAGDGGLYGEMLQNRSFEDPKRDTSSVNNNEKPGGWELIKGEGADVSMTLDDSKPLNANNKHSLKVTVKKIGKGAGVANIGFRNQNDARKEADAESKYGIKNGVSVQKDKKYNLSFYARAGAGFKSSWLLGGGLTVGIQAKDGKLLAEKTVKGIGANWKKFTVTLTSSETNPDTNFVILSRSTGTFYLDMVSLFPQDAFKKRSNGLRADLAQMVADMKPKFIRFPGGCFVEGNTLENANRWKKTIGDVAERPGHWNLWGYWSNDGFGAYEFLQYCEDIQAEPLYVINCGMSHREQGFSRSPDAKSQYKVNVDEYLQDAMDFIEYANGPADSKWGGLRAKAGHPAPFNLKYMEIGNENGGPIYNENYEKFRSAILAKYPKMRLVACDWTGSPDKKYLDILDEHYYDSPGFFFRSANKYDSYDRKGPKIYVGEYASTKQCGRGNLIAAVGEAAFMTGMERNSDVVEMCSYAPLFVNPGWQSWNPNAIVFDSAHAYGTPSYHVQALFGNNKPDVILPVEMQSMEEPLSPISGSIGLGSYSTQVEYKDIKVTGSKGEILFNSKGMKTLEGWKKNRGAWAVSDGVIKQVSNDTPTCILLGDKAWNNYTLTLKARKDSGAEGFQILFDTKNTESPNMWNIGGWQNTKNSVEWDPVTEYKQCSVEAGRWYDVKIEVSDKAVKCYLDGQLLHDVARPTGRQVLHTVAGYKQDTKEVIVKVVNGTPTPRTGTVTLAGSKSFVSGKAIVLANSDPDAENTFAEPQKVAPKEEKLEKVSDNKVERTFPANSVTVLRLQEKK